MLQTLGREGLGERRRAARLNGMSRAIIGDMAWNDISRGISLSGVFKSRKDHNMKIKLEYKRTNWGKYSFIGRGVRDWNNLPREMFDRFPTSLKLFRRRLGKQLIWNLPPGRLS